MKNALILTSALLTFATSAMAAPKCYSVDNPKSIVVLGRGSKIIDNVIEQAKSASVVIDNQADGASESSTIKLVVQSETMKFSSMATDPKNPKGYRQYYVDCDGGNISASVDEGKLALRTDYMGGDVIISDSCVTGQITIMGAALLSEVACK